ncbi:ferrous-iron efflux pump FieF [Marchantia polymorpha subsp. ruderalis]
MRNLNQILRLRQSMALSFNSPANSRTFHNFAASLSSVISSRVLSNVGREHACQLSSRTSSDEDDESSHGLLASRQSGEGPSFASNSDFFPAGSRVSGAREPQLPIGVPANLCSGLALRFRQYMSSSCQRSSPEVGPWASRGRQRESELVGGPIWHTFRRGHMGHAHHTPGERDNTGKAGERVLRWGLWGDIFLAIGKGGAGFVSGSTAIIADAAHSVSDIALSGVALWSSKVASAPKDKEHPYGHGKFETVGALGISGMLLLTGGGIAWHAVETLQDFIPLMSELVQAATDSHHGHAEGGHQHGIDLEHPFVALSAAVVSIVVKEALYWQTKKVGEQQKSELLKASAWHHRSDAISSVVALVGVGGAMLGMPLLDPVAGLLVSGMIVKAGMETGYQSLQELVDSGVSESVLSPIRNTVLHVQGVEGCHHLRGRRMGSFIHVDAHIEVDPWLSVSAAYNIGEAVRHQLQKEHPEVAETFVHIEPADGGSKTVTPEEAEIEAHLHDHLTSHDNHPHGDDQHLTKRDLTKNGSKSDLLTNDSFLDGHCASSFEADSRQHSEIEQDVRRVVNADFREKMTIAHVTSHYLKGKVVVEVEVLMNPDISVRDAMAYANDAEEVILRKVYDISAVHVQLKLSKTLSESAPS